MSADALAYNSIVEVGAGLAGRRAALGLQLHPHQREVA